MQVNYIQKEIRQNLFDAIELEEIFFGGNLGDVDFLGRLYDLTKMPSNDDRFEDASGDIWQHCHNNQDWPRNWVFADSRFNLLYCADQEFLTFLCEMVHPVIRPERADAETLVSHFNEQLEIAGYRIVGQGKIAGRSKFVAEKTRVNNRHITRAFTTAETLSSNWMQIEVKRIQDSIEADPALAVGTAKDLVESCCKTILVELGKPPATTDDLPKLTRSLAKELNLLPADVSKEAKGSEIIKRTLSNLVALTRGIAELRGLYGTGHGKDGNHVGIEPRHARLAVSSAITFIDFVTETYDLKHRKPDLK